jgi:hypothetical protein
MKKRVNSPDQIDEVERCRQVRRAIESRFATTAEFFAWIQSLEQERVSSRSARSKRKRVKPASKARKSQKLTRGKSRKAG